MGLLDSIYGDFRPSDNIEDRRGPNGGTSPGRTPELKNVPDSLQSIAVALGNYLWGTPSIPEAPNSPLSDALGKRDVQIVPQINSRSPLDRAIDTVSDEISMFRKPGEKLGSDAPFTQRGFPNFAPQGIMGNLTDNIVRAESGGNPNATNPNSSASGLGQFIDSTFLSTFKAARPEQAQGMTDQQILALKTDPQISREMTEVYANQNQAILSKAGVPVTDGNTYLAHFAGPGGAVKVLQANPTASVGDILGPGVVKANPFLANMTAADLQAWAAKKVGGSAPTQGQPAPASPAAPPSAPLASTQQAPIFPLAPPAQPQQQQPGGLFDSMPAQQGMSLPPIQFPQRHSPDLSKLRAAFKAPVFSRG